MLDSAGGNNSRFLEWCHSEIWPDYRKLWRKTCIREYYNKGKLETKEVCSAGRETSLTVSRQATGAAAFQRGLLLVILQKLRSSPLRLLDVDENTREASNPAVFIIGGR